MRKNIVLILVMVFANNCAQTNKNAPMDFVEYNGDLKYSASSGDGIVYFRCYHGYSDDSENPYGNARVYMIHKNGGNWWMKQAKKEFPEMAYPEDWYVENLYKNEDSMKLEDYHKWAFFIDKKYLKAETSGGGEKDVVYTSYFPTYPYTVVLYEQKAGSDEWVEIDRKTFHSEEEKIKENCEWECRFYNNKLKELNEKFKE